MDPKERKEYVQGWRKREKDREKELEKLAQQALNRATQIALLLVNKYNVEKVILFGSLSKNTFREESDIDLALINSDRDLYLQTRNGSLAAVLVLLSPVSLTTSRARYR
ncbi:MAG: nucleotidyltransferase family protein [Halanaerobiales bacterium]